MALCSPNSLSSLQACVRLGSYPDSPEVLTNYLQLRQREIAQLSACEARRSAYFKLAFLLVEAICDSVVPHQWRCLCLEYMHIPLLEIERLSKSKRHRIELFRFRRELTTLVRYFL